MKTLTLQKLQNNETTLDADSKNDYPQIYRQNNRCLLANLVFIQILLLL